MNKAFLAAIFIALTLLCIVSHTNGAIVSGEFGANWVEVDSLWRHAGAFSVSEPDSVYHITAIPNYVQIYNLPVESAITQLFRIWETI